MSNARENVDKLNTFMSVKQFGAIGDGVADDTAAIQAALNAALAVDFGGPGFVYKISGALTVQSGAYLTGRGATIRQTTNVTSIFNVSNRSNVTIEGFVFDDTGAGYVENDSNPHAPIFATANAQFITIVENKFTNVTYAAIRFAGTSKDIIVRTNTIVGPGAGTIPSGSNLRCYGVLFDVGASRVLIDGNNITATTHGIRLEQVSDVSCVNNLIHNITGQHGFYIGAGCARMNIAANTIFNIALQGVKVQAGNGLPDVVDISITDNVIFNTGAQGIAVNIGDPGTQPDRHRNINIVGNTINDAGNSGIDVRFCVQAIVASNVIKTCAFNGILFSACTNLLVEGNVIQDCGLSGMRDIAACSFLTILDNTVRNCATANDPSGDRVGLRLNGVGSDYVIDGNAFYDDAAKMQYGIFIAAAINATLSITNNLVAQATDTGLRLSSTITLREYSGNYWNGSILATFNDPAAPIISSAGILTLPQQWNIVSITGTTNITEIRTGGHSNRIVTLVFDDALTVTNGSNLRLASNFVTTANDTLTLACNGTNWFEVTRSVN